MFEKCTSLNACESSFFCCHKNSSLLVISKLVVLIALDRLFTCMFPALLGEDHHQKQKLAKM